MTQLFYLTRRNIKLFFQDKGMFFTALITPLILLVLYATFLGNVYKESFTSALPEGLTVADSLIGGMVGGELFSSLLAVCCITVAFCSNMIMVQDKVNGARIDLTMAPVKGSILALGYYIGTAIVTLIICFATTGICFLYLANVGWYLSGQDVLGILLDVFLLVMFGTALSTGINYFVSTQGQMSAVGTIVSAGYGFLCGAYMPISSFSSGLQKILSFLPGTYGTALIRNHAMGGVFREMEVQGFQAEIVEAIKDGVDCNLYFFEHQVSTGEMYTILGGTVILLIGVCALLHTCEIKSR